MEENEGVNEYMDLNWVLKKLWKMNVTVISIVIGTLGMVLKRLQKYCGKN